MVDLTIKDASAQGGPCGCGCGGHDSAPETVEPAKASCNCDSGCTCGCQEGGACTCGGDAKVAAEGPGARYTVTGMTCSHCATAITEEVSALPGVTDVQVDWESGSLRVVSEAPIDFDRIVEAVAEAGDYTVS